MLRITMKVRNCRVCGKTFEAQRKTALYCSSVCRQRAFRIRGGRDMKRIPSLLEREVTQADLQAFGEHLMRTRYQPALDYLNESLRLLLLEEAELSRKKKRTKKGSHA